MNSYDKNIYDQPHKEKWQEISSKLQYQSKESLNNQVDNIQSRFTKSYNLDSEGKTQEKEIKSLIKWLILILLNISSHLILI